MITGKIEYCAKSFNVPEPSTLNLYSPKNSQSQDIDSEGLTEDNISKKDTPHLTQSTSLQTQNSSKIELTSYIHDDSISDVEIPLRRQSRLYTPYHEELPPTPYGLTNNRLSNQQIYGDYNNSQLTRSVSWNPQKQQEQQQEQPLPLRSNRPIRIITDQDTRPDESTYKKIPDRRTSRNYANDPEAQARLNHLLSTERRFFVRGTSMIDRKPPPL
ncbi:hypothetical protein K501DRAFT_275627 [Backusella circina FSU 941]|nr:hypothetical protein K501DRAFT_275627 [Backusella circina FSU 941]